MEIEKSFDQTVEELLRVTSETPPEELDPRELEHAKRLILSGMGHSGRRDLAYLYLSANDPLTRSGLEHVDEEKESLRSILDQLRVWRRGGATTQRQLAAYELMFARRIDRLIVQGIPREQLGFDVPELVRLVTGHYGSARLQIITPGRQEASPAAYTFVLHREERGDEFIVLVYSGVRPNEIYCFVANPAIVLPLVEAPRRIVLTTRLSEAFLARDQTLRMGVTGFFYLVQETMRISSGGGGTAATDQSTLRQVSELFYYCDLATLMAFHLAFLRRFYLEYYLTPEEERHPRESTSSTTTTTTYETTDPIDVLCEYLGRLDVPLILRRTAGGVAVWGSRVALMIENEARITTNRGYTKPYIASLQDTIVALLLDEASQRVFSRDDWLARLSVYRQYRS